MGEGEREVKDRFKTSRASMLRSILAQSVATSTTVKQGMHSASILSVQEEFESIFSLMPLSLHESIVKLSDVSGYSDNIPNLCCCYNNGAQRLPRF